jgi:hypothetical protein
MATKLYRVRSTKDDGAKIIWIALDRKHPPVRYATAIKGLSADVEAGDRAQEAVDELFTYEEALPLEPTAKALSYTGAARLRRVVKKEAIHSPTSGQGRE